MPFWTYLLRCSDGRYYTGHTDDLDVRLAQHQQGCFRTCWTFTRRPVELVWSEAFPTRDEALVAERMVGGWSRAKKEALIRGDWGLLSYLARPPRERGSRFSTSLETNARGENTGEGKQGAHDKDASTSQKNENTQGPFVSSEVEKREVEKRP
jgi:putative endonuclease